MPDPLREEIVNAAHTVVVKVGTRVLTLADGTLNHERIDALAEELHRMAGTENRGQGPEARGQGPGDRGQGTQEPEVTTHHSPLTTHPSPLRSPARRVVLVSSGAVGAGISKLSMKQRPTDLAKLQAVAAVGQTHLIQAYERTFAKHGRHAAQVLLTAEDMDDRTRYLNVRNTLLSILELGAIPVINENDTVSVEELMTTFGDNDRLAALVTNLIRAPLLIVLSDIEGLYDGDPSKETSQLVSTVDKIDEQVLSYVRDKKTGLSKGGMASKLEAARIVTQAGENMIIASGRQQDVLTRLMAGEPLGTLFRAQGKGITPFKRWLGFTAQTRGRISLDAGARKAIVEQGRSLLAAGIVGASGDFQKGDVVALCDADGQIVARGLSNYASAEIERIKGLRSDKIAQVLGKRPYEEVIHRDNLAIVHK